VTFHAVSSVLSVSLLIFFICGIYHFVRSWLHLWSVSCRVLFGTLFTCCQLFLWSWSFWHLSLTAFVLNALFVNKVINWHQPYNADLKIYVTFNVAGAGFSCTGEYRRTQDFTVGGGSRGGRPDQGFWGWKSPSGVQGQSPGRGSGGLLPRSRSKMWN